ncbi:hypothetical protein [Streptomyces sp. NPDC051132]|uniref:hypothetical protein n=1 Tax=unclassified Streptomyces TaxID=2593676 RepID=UPI00343F33EB
MLGERLLELVENRHDVVDLHVGDPEGDGPVCVDVAAAASAASLETMFGEKGLERMTEFFTSVRDGA